MQWKDIRRIESDEGNVCKFVYKNNTAVAESVLYRYPTYKERTVICCSTQSGCPVGCRFCGAGDHFVRNRKIVGACEILIACPFGRKRTSGGTWYTIDRANQVGRRTMTIFPLPNERES